MSIPTPRSSGTRFERTMPVVTTTRLVQYAGASGDYNRIHYDQAYATDDAGLGGLVAHGMLTMAFMGNAVTEWGGPSAFVHHLDARFTAPVRPNDVVSVKAIVTAARAMGADLALTAYVGDRLVAEGHASVAWQP